MKPTNTTMGKIKATAADPALAHKISAITLAAALLINPDFQRYTAARQREIFGGAPFGKRAIRHNADRGGFDVYRRVAFGQDFDIQFWSYAEITALVVLRETVVGWRD